MKNDKICTLLEKMFKKLWEEAIYPDPKISEAVNKHFWELF